MAEVRPMYQAAFDEWVEALPPKPREVARHYPPSRLYRMEAGQGHRVTIVSYANNGTVTVNVSGKYNAVIFERNVFGVDPTTLEECDLPNSDELVGALT